MRIILREDEDVSCGQAAAASLPAMSESIRVFRYEYFPAGKA
jgi:hypothetical protein